MDPRNLFLLLLSSGRIGLIITAWHAYDKSTVLKSDVECPIYSETTKTLPISVANEYRLWPGLSDDEDIKNGETLYGFRETMKMIWDHQHPKNCSTSKFLISFGWPGGIGAVAHVEGLALAIAMDLGRVLIPHPDGPVRHGPRDMGFYVDNGWQVDVPFCQNQGKKTMECYFEPWSSCTIDDALRYSMLYSLILETVVGINH